jgi:serine/threonine protein kinase/predicted negative regulator of RcsB-dependent stress response
MTPERWQQLKELLAPALDLGVSQRSAYLEQVCLGEPSLRSDLERLLAAEDKAGTGFLSGLAPFGDPGDDSHSGSKPLIGLRVGSYKIVEEIGSGGMGEVYRAFRADDQYRKQVAIKLVRAGQDSKAVVQRFKNERQILAGLDHPNIARLLDGGETEDGLPYFVMELIEGMPIDKYCDDRKLTITDRLVLLRQVCFAVQYAHQHLTIHRDIKPSNILVTPDGVPKLLDFGIARMLDPTADEGQLQPTLTIFRALTPGYASPEQVTGAAITTASDLYSLGVVLYELLTSRSPYRLTGRSPQEIALAVCEVESEKPSTMVSRIQTEEDGNGSPATAAEVAALRQVSPDKLSKRLAGDLDNIVLMALRKEPQRRYASVEQFAEDIRRHLENLPVIARKDAVGYRTSKFLTRHKAGVASAAAIFLTLVLGMAATLREAQIARAQQARAERHFKDIRELSNSLMIDIHDAIQDLPGSTPARKMLVDRSLKYLDRLASESGGDTSLLRELATAYERVATVQGNPFGANLGDLQGATVSYRKAALIWDSLSKANPGNTQDLVGLARTYRQLAGTVANVGGGDPLELMQKAVDVSERMESSVSVDPQVAEELELDYRRIASIQIRTGGDPEGALTNCRKALSIAAQRLNSSPTDRMLQRNVGAIKGRMGEILAELGARGEALESSRQALEILRSLARDPTDAWAHRVLALYGISRGDILLMSGDSAGALQSYRQGQAGLERLATSDPQNAQVRVELATSYARVGHALSREGNERGALAMFKRAIGVFEPMARDPQHSEARDGLASSHIWMGESLATTGETSRALENYKMGATDSLALVTLMPWDCYHRSRLAASHGKIGDLLAKMGKDSEAAAEYQSALEIAKPLASAKPRNRLPWYTIADAYSGLGSLSRMAVARSSGNPQKERQGWTEAREWYQQSVEAWQHITYPGVITSAGFDVGDPTQVAKQLAVCEAALEKLKSSPAATTASEMPAPKVCK